jgi:predicted solute-binding protein
VEKVEKWGDLVEKWGDVRKELLPVPLGFRNAEMP